MPAVSSADLQAFVEPGAPATVDAPAGLSLDEACEWLRGMHDAVRAALDQHGALYLRGLPVRSAADFARIRDAQMTERAVYKEKATPRSHFGDDVYSSTDLPPAQPIRLHNENSYTLSFPGLLMFCCLVAPERGGATPVADCRRVLDAVPTGLAERFRTMGWMLTRNYSEHISLDWRTAFGTNDRAAVDDYCARNAISSEWCDDGHLRTRQRRAAVIHHPRTGEAVWFNHVAFWNEWSLDDEVREVLVDELGRDNLPFNTGFGDGQPLTEEEVAALNAAYDSATVRRAWQPGDVLIVDNVLTAHGRESFSGDRKVLVAMGDPVMLGDCRPTVAASAELST